VKFRVPQSLKNQFQTFVVELATALGVSIDDSNIGRPLLERLLVEDRERILQTAKDYRGKLRRPVNRDPLAMAEFDEQIGAIFADAHKRRRTARRGDE
jgi:hypothetical protein